MNMSFDVKIRMRHFLVIYKHYAFNDLRGYDTRKPLDLSKVSNPNFSKMPRMTSESSPCVWKTKMNATNNAGYTAFVWACINGHKDVVKLLLYHSDSIIDH